MAVDATVAALACGRAHRLLIDLRLLVPADTPAALLLSAAAVHVDLATSLLADRRPDQMRAARLLVQAITVLEDVPTVEGGPEREPLAGSLGILRSLVRIVALP
jgi:hypothetical protein